MSEEIKQNLENIIKDASKKLKKIKEAEKEKDLEKKLAQVIGLEVEVVDSGSVYRSWKEMAKKLGANNWEEYQGDIKLKHKYKIVNYDDFEKIYLISDGKKEFLIGNLGIYPWSDIKL